MSDYSYVLLDESKPLEGAEALLGVFHRKYEAKHFVEKHNLDATALKLYAYKYGYSRGMDKRLIPTEDWFGDKDYVSMWRARLRKNHNL